MSIVYGDPHTSETTGSVNNGSSPEQMGENIKNVVKFDLDENNSVHW